MQISIILQLFLLILIECDQLAALKIRGGKTGNENSCISIRIQNQTTKLNQTNLGQNYLNANVNDQLRLLISDSCNGDIECVILTHGQHSSPLLSEGFIPLKPGHDFISCKRDSKDYLNFHLFVKEGEHFFNQAMIVDQNKDEFVLRCLGGFYTKDVKLRANGKEIDLPYNPLEGFSMDKKIYSNRTFYQCVHHEQKISFLYYQNQNTYKSNVEYKMKLLPFAINSEIQCIIDGTVPNGDNIKTLLACQNNVFCPKLAPRTRIGKKTVYTASLPETSSFNPHKYTCVFIRNEKVEALAFITNEKSSVKILVNFIFVIGIVFALFILIVNKFGAWKYIKLKTIQIYVFDETKLNLEENTLLCKGNSSEIRLTQCDPPNKPLVIKYSKYVWQFKKELKMLSSLKHPNIIPAYGYVNIPNKTSRLSIRTPHLVLPYYQKMCLEKFIRQFFPVRRIENDFYSTEDSQTICLFDLISFGWQISQALHFLKQQGVTHRDVAMRNVLIADNYVCKLADFEKAKKGETHDLSIATQLLKFFTIHSPDVPTMYPVECKNGAYFYESEVYCFGLLLLEMFSFLKPLEPNHRWPPVQPMNCPMPIFSLILECLTKDRKKRPSIETCVAKLATAAEVYGGQKYTDMKNQLERETNRDFLEEFLQKKVEYGDPDAKLFVPIVLPNQIFS